MGWEGRKSERTEWALKQSGRAVKGVGHVLMRVWLCDTW
jgi:hypothetical protein